MIDMTDYNRNARLYWWTMFVTGVFSVTYSVGSIIAGTIPRKG